MGYVGVKGGWDAIEASLERMTYERLKYGQILEVQGAYAGLRALIDQTMSESSLWAPAVAAIAVKQAEGSPEEAVFLLRAYRSTLPRSYYSEEMCGEGMRISRRISACFKDIPGGQLLGASCDYTHRLIDFSLETETSDGAKEFLQTYLEKPVPTDLAGSDRQGRVSDYLRAEGLLKTCPRNDTPPADVTKRSVTFPTVRSERLQILTRAQTGALTALGMPPCGATAPCTPPSGNFESGGSTSSSPPPGEGVWKIRMTPIL